MRYFFFSYSWSNTIEYQHLNTVYPKTESGTGNITLRNPNFPTETEIKHIARESLSYAISTSTIIITNWNEFKNKEDFDNFQSQDDEVKT